MTITLETLGIDQLETLQELSIKTFSQTFADSNSAEDLQNYLDKAYALDKLAAELANPASHFYFALVDGQVAGYLKVNEAPAQTELNDPESLEIERIYVLADYQGHGLGRALMDKALELAIDLGKTKVWLGVWEHNAKAMAFYKKKGFYRIGQHSFFMGEDEQVDYLMQKDL